MAGLKHRGATAACSAGDPLRRGCISPTESQDEQIAYSERAETHVPLINMEVTEKATGADDFITIGLRTASIKTLSQQTSEDEEYKGGIEINVLNYKGLTRVGNRTELEVFEQDSDSDLSPVGTDADPDQKFFDRTDWSSNYISLESLAKQMQHEINSDNSPFSILHINCRSLTHKLKEVREIIDKLQTTVLAVTETWLGPNMEDTIYIPGYVFLSRPRVGNRGGGVGFFVKEDLSYQQYCSLGNSSKHSTYESMFIKVQLKKCSQIIGVIYRSPGQHLKDFNEEFEELVSCIRNKSKDAILLGDFNIDLLKINEHAETNKFYNCLISSHYLPTITRPTRITDYSHSLIDNIFCSSWSKLVTSSILVSDLSCHLPVFASFSLETPKARSDRRDARLVNEEGLSQFKRALSEMN